MQTDQIGFNTFIFFLGCTEAAHCNNEADKGVCNTDFKVCSGKFNNIYKKTPIILFKEFLQYPILCVHFYLLWQSDL